MSYVLIILVLAGAGFGYSRWSKHQRQQTLLATPLSDEERAIVLDQVPLVANLPHKLRAKLEGKINLFLDQIEFIGCDGLEVTDQMRFSIAAQACLLVANKTCWYKNLRTILIYPGAFKSRGVHVHGDVVTERETVRIGESWARGPVVLSWAHTERGAFIDDDGHNVVFHEFAHQLDDLSGYTNGAPILAKGHSLWDWERIFTDAYDRLVEAVDAEQETFLDPYGATSPEEYFAVVVELFLERPRDLQREEPAVYDQLAQYFGLDPARWV